MQPEESKAVKLQPKGRRGRKNVVDKDNHDTPSDEDSQTARAVVQKDGNELVTEVTKEQEAEFETDYERAESDSVSSGDDDEVAFSGSQHRDDQVESKSSASESEVSMQSDELTQTNLEPEPPLVKKHKRKISCKKRSKSIMPKLSRRCREQFRPSPRKRGKGKRRSKSRDSICEAIAELQGMMEGSGYGYSDEEFDRRCSRDREHYSKRRDNRKRSKVRSGMSVGQNSSEVTIYKLAIRPERGSTLSDGMIDTSNETVELDVSGLDQTDQYRNTVDSRMQSNVFNDSVDKFITETRRDSRE